MSMAMQESSFNVAQLGRIAKTCTRWIGIKSLPAPIRCRLEELDCLSQRLLAQPASQEDDAALLLARVQKSCRVLRQEFAKIQVSFVCPSCPLRAANS